MDRRTDLIRDRAYQLWIDAGQPNDRHAEHWSQAEREIDEESTSEPNKATAIGPAGDVAGAFTRPTASADNDAMTSANPRPLSGDGDGSHAPGDRSSNA